MGRKPNPGVSVYKNSGYYLARWYHDGIKHSRSVGSMESMTLRTAKEKAEKMYRDFLERDKQSLTGDDITLSQWSKAYSDEVGNITHATLRNQLAALKMFIECVGDLRMRDVGPDHARKFARWLSDLESGRIDEHGKAQKVTHATIASHLARLTRVFAVAVDRSQPIMLRSPFAGKIGKELRRTYTTSVKAPHTHVDIETFDKLIGSSKVSWQVGMLSLARLAAMRRIECVDCRWSDIDFQAGTITVRGKTDKHGREVTTTKRKRRICPMSKRLANILAGIRSNNPDSKGPCDGSPAGEGYVAQLWQLIDDAGVKPYGKPMHALRASCINEWMDAGHQIADIAEWAGHSIDVMMEHYRERDATRRLSQFHERDVLTVTKQS